MAIHVRSTRRAHRILHELRIKLARMAALVALMSVLLGGITLYLIRIFSPPSPTASFIAWQEPGGEPERAEPQQESRATGVVKPVQMSVTPVIVSMAESIPLPDTIDIEIDDSEDLLADVSAEVESSQGDAAGDGDSDDGAGGGKGGFGNGKDSGHGKGGALGYNDDVQVVLVLDASGSMDRLFLAVANSLEELLRTLGECKVNGKQASVNVGIVVYGQARDNGAPFQLTPFTLELEHMRAEVQSINCDGAIENCGEAIDFAVKSYPWNKRNRRQLLKVLFIAGNESFDQGPIDYRDALAAAREKDIIVNTIHCGEPSPEWSVAARMGGGEGLTFAMHEAESMAAMPRGKRGELISILYNQPFLPVGSPAEQEELRKAHKSRPPLPDLHNESAVRSWAKQHLESLLRGSRGDAVGIFCQLGDGCSVDALGGRGNLPPELRGIEDVKILETLSNLAKERREIVGLLSMNDDSFIGKLLNTLIRQAAARQIEIKK